MERISSSSLRSMVARLAGMTLFPPRHPLVPVAAALLWQPKWQPPGAPAGPEAHPPLTAVGWCLDAVYLVQIAATALHEEVLRSPRTAVGAACAARQSLAYFAAVKCGSSNKNPLLSPGIPRDAAQTPSPISRGSWLRITRAQHAQSKRSAQGPSKAIQKRSAQIHTHSVSASRHTPKLAAAMPTLLTSSTSLPPPAHARARSPDQRYCSGAGG